MSRHKKPLVNTEPLDEFGAAHPEDFADPTGQARDLTYVPGFSELRRERDLALVEYAQGVRRGQEVPTLPVNVRGVRVARVKDGTPEGVKIMSARNDGYRPVLQEDVGQPWFTALPPGARVLPSGEIINAAGDLMYMVAPARRVAANQARKRRAADALTANVGEDTDGLGAVGRKLGVDPSIAVST